MKYKGKAWKVIKCPNCGKYFKSEYMKQYHLNTTTFVTLSTLITLSNHVNHGITLLSSLD